MFSWHISTFWQYRWSCHIYYQNLKFLFLGEKVFYCFQMLYLQKRLYYLLFGQTESSKTSSSDPDSSSSLSKLDSSSLSSSLSSSSSGIKQCDHGTENQQNLTYSLTNFSAKKSSKTWEILLRMGKQEVRNACKILSLSFAFFLHATFTLRRELEAKHISRCTYTIWYILDYINFH